MKASKLGSFIVNVYAHKPESWKLWKLFSGFIVTGFQTKHTHTLNWGVQFSTCYYSIIMKAYHLNIVFNNNETGEWETSAFRCRCEIALKGRGKELNIKLDPIFSCYIVKKFLCTWDDNLQTRQSIFTDNSEIAKNKSNTLYNLIWNEYLTTTLHGCILKKQVANED